MVRRVRAALLAACLAVAGSARADDGDAYRALVAKGIAEFNVQNFQEARAFFLRAHALFPSARTLRSLGLVSYAMRRYVSAVDYMERAIHERERPLTEAMRSELTAKLEDARGFITPVRFITDPADVRVLVDGQPAAVGDDGRLMLDPGRHEIVAHAPGYRPVAWKFVATGEPGELFVSLQRVPSRAQAKAETSVQTPKARPTDPTSDVSFFDSLTTTQWIGIGCGAAAVVGVGVGITLSVLAVNDNQASAAHCELNNCDGAGVRQRDRALARADIATVSFIASGALAATGTTLFLTGALEEPPARALRLAPAVSSRAVALTLRGPF